MLGKQATATSLRKGREHLLRASKRLGLFSSVRDSRWRRRRLVILGYHGISLDDEHEWDPSLFMDPAQFRQRLTLLRDGGYQVLPLDQALQLLRADELPQRCVAITFDDGYYDFYAQARPILQEFGYPATVYLTTYYCRYNKPVFDVVCSYILWKARGRVVDRKGITGQDGVLDLRTPASRDAALSDMYSFASTNRLSAEEKDNLASALAQHVGVDYDAIVAKRILHLMTADEVARLPRESVDIQLHTHRHCTPSDRAAFLQEIVENRSCIRTLTGSPAEPSHFCYPSGEYRGELLPWLREVNVVSATTCDFGIVSGVSNPLLLPRLIDTALLSPIEFEGWLTGVSSFLPRRPSRRVYHSLRALGTAALRSFNGGALAVAVRAVADIG